MSVRSIFRFYQLADRRYNDRKIISRSRPVIICTAAAAAAAAPLALSVCARMLHLCDVDCIVDTTRVRIRDDDNNYIPTVRMSVGKKKIENGREI